MILFVKEWREFKDFLLCGIRAYEVCFSSEDVMIFICGAFSQSYHNCCQKQACF